MIAYHPYLLIMGFIGVLAALLSVSQADPSLLRYILGASVLALAIRLWQLSAEARRARRPSASIDFEELRGRDFARYAGWLKENVRGQDEAVDRVVKRLQQGLGLAGRGRLLGSLMLVGPTGTGKTFLAELVAKALYPDAEPILLRMNQYKDPTDVDTLLGAPPGRGEGASGALTSPLLEEPRRVLILDEFDKAHPDVQHCFYDILDAGQCRERSSGRVAHLNACAVFATSNAGTELLRPSWKKGGEASGSRDALVSAGFEKALIARFDEIVLMDELAPLHVAEVAALELARHWRQYGIEVTYAAPEVLMEAVRRNGEFREYGVRQLERLVRELTDAPLEEARRKGLTVVRLALSGTSGRITCA